MNINEKRVPLFTEADVISTYSRAQALEDGVLVDVTEWASNREMMGGFTIPVAVTADLWAGIESTGDVRGRAHDVLWMACLAARRHPGTDFVGFEVYLQIGRRKKQRLCVHVGPGDLGEPVVTIGFPGDF